MLTQERLKELLDYDPETGAFTWKVRVARRTKVGAPAGSKVSNGYIHIAIDYKDYKAHRLAWLYTYGCWPDGQIDHVNRIKDDNRISNLRCVSQNENQWNQIAYKNNKAGFMGVHWRKDNKKWRASIRVHGKLKSLGHFDTQEEAHAAYLAAKAEHHKF